MTIPKLEWTGVMIEADGEGVAYPMGNSNDSLMQKIVDACNKSETSERTVAGLCEALKKAKETIHALHGPIAWDIYDRCSPEMKQINAALLAEHASGSGKERKRR